MSVKVGLSRFDIMVSQFKAYIITEELIKYEGNVCKAAEAFGMHRNSLHRNIEEHNVDLQGIKRKIRDKRYGRDKSGSLQADGSGSTGGITAIAQRSTAGAQGDADTDGSVLACAGV